MGRSVNPHAAALGRLGGQATSEAKAAAARANAKRPRPNAKGKKKPRKASGNTVGTAVTGTDPKAP